MRLCCDDGDFAVPRPSDSFRECCLSKYFADVRPERAALALPGTQVPSAPNLPGLPQGGMALDALCGRERIS